MKPVVSNLLKLGAAAGLAALLASCASMGAPKGPLEIHVVAFNDFHGNLEAPASVPLPDPEHPGQTVPPGSGGAARFSTLSRQLLKRPNSIMVAAGDLIGASPLLSGLFHDEPTVESLSAMGLAITSVGNHEFDEGVAELHRMQDGGCHPKDGARRSKRPADKTRGIDSVTGTSHSTPPPVSSVSNAAVAMSRYGPTPISRLRFRRNRTSARAPRWKAARGPSVRRSVAAPPTVNPRFACGAARAGTAAVRAAAAHAPAVHRRRPSLRRIATRAATAGRPPARCTSCRSGSSAGRGCTMW